MVLRKLMNNKIATTIAKELKHRKMSEANDKAEYDHFNKLPMATTDLCPTHLRRFHDNH